MGIKRGHTPSPSSVDRFLCGKTLMKKTYCIGDDYLGYQTAVGDMVLESKSNPLKSTHPQS